MLGALAPILSACGAPARPGRVLRVFLGLDAYERGAFERDIIPDYAARAGVDLQLTAGTGAETRELIAAGGRADVPDLAALDLEAIGDLAAGQSIAWLEDQRPFIPSTVPPATIAALTWNQTLVALPWRPAVWIAYYNRAYFAALGTVPPDSWRALASAAGASKARDGTGMVALQGASEAPAAQSMIELVWSFGGNPLRLDDSGSLAAARFLASLAPELSPVTANGKIDTIGAAIGSGQLAWGLNWSVAARELLQKAGNPDLAAYAGPSGPAGLSHLLSGQVFVLPRGTRERELALDFARYLWSPAIQRWAAARLAWVPLLPAAFDALPAWFQPAGGAIRTALNEARHLPPLPNRPELQRVLSEVFRAIAFERKSPEGVLAAGSGRLRGLNLPSG